MTSVNEIERAINGMLQTNVVFALESKILKRGKLILFCIKDFFCVFTLISEEKNKKIVYEIPYPFSFNEHPKKIIFDYTLNTFCRNNNNLDFLVKKINYGKPSKFFNKKITISSV